MTTEQKAKNKINWAAIFWVGYLVAVTIGFGKLIFISVTAFLGYVVFVLAVGGILAFVLSSDDDGYIDFFNRSNGGEMSE